MSQARQVQLTPFRRQAPALEALKAEIRANLEANPRATRRDSKFFRDLGMIRQGRQVTFVRNGAWNGHFITYFLAASGEIYILSEPRFRAFYPEMQRHIESTIEAIAARLARAA